MSSPLPANSVAERYLRLCDHYLTLSDRFADLQGSHDLVQLKFAELHSQYQALLSQTNTLIEAKAAAQATITEMQAQIQALTEQNHYLTTALAQAEAAKESLVQERQAWESRCHALEVLEEFHSLMDSEALHRLSEVEQAIALNQEILSTAPSQDLEQATTVMRQYAPNSRAVRHTQPVSVSVSP